jgi:hypothetical protein
VSDVETSVEPPVCDHHGDGGEGSARLTVNLLGADDVSYDAAVQLYGEAALDPERFADALLRAALAVAHLAGPDHAWAAARRFASYDGGMR